MYKLIGGIMQHIIINGQKLINIHKVGRTNIYTLANNTKLINKDFQTIGTECPTCLIIRPIKKLHDYNLKKVSECSRCKCSGPKNPFYGKKHSKKTLKIIQQKNEIYRNNLSIEEKEKISKKLSESQKQLYDRNPQDYIAKRSKAGKITATKIEKYKINSIEKIVRDKLKELGLDLEYSVILDYKQFDFGSKKYRILLEVQGDYWHGNPSIYTKKHLNDTQKRNIKKDKDKATFAKKHSMKLYYIWETDIRANNFTVLEEIKNEICARANN